MAIFNDLPEEIVQEILTRLPTESVLKSKLVCKPWKDLVHLGSFSQLHLNHCLNSANDTGELKNIVLKSLNKFYYAEYNENCLETRTTRLDLNIPFKNHYAFVSSCNGLVCFRSWSAKYRDDPHYSGPAYICNPITREYVILPEFEGKYWWTGFGCSTSTNEYKVVRIYVPEGDSNVGMVQVYTLGSGTGWRDAGTAMDVDMQYFGRCVGVFVNGALHWVNYEGTIVLAFCLDNEKFSQLPSPPPCLTRDADPYYAVTIGVLGGFLSATFGYKARGCEIWLLKKSKDNDDLGWSKECYFYSHIPRRQYDLTRSGWLMCHENYNIRRYDPKALSEKMDVNFGLPISEAIPHKNTLVSLKVLGEKDTKTMERASSSKEAENSDKLKKPLNKVRGLIRRILKSISMK